MMAAGVAKAAAATNTAIQGYVARQASQPKLEGQPVKVSPALRTRWGGGAGREGGRMQDERRGVGCRTELEA
jgi:hypothetical protein